MSTCIPRPKNGLQVKERTPRVPNTIPINMNWLHKPKNVLQAYAAPPKNVLQVAPNQLNGIVKVMDPFTEERTSGEWADCLQVGFNRVPLTENTAPRFPSQRAITIAALHSSGLSCDWHCMPCGMKYLMNCIDVEARTMENRDITKMSAF